MSLNKLYSEFALVTRIKFPFVPRPNLIFYKPYVTSRNGPLMHNTTAYTSQIQNRNTWLIDDYHNELWENSKSSYTFVWATAKKVQELLSKSVHKGTFMDPYILVHIRYQIRIHGNHSYHKCISFKWRELDEKTYKHYRLLRQEFFDWTIWPCLQCIFYDEKLSTKSYSETEMSSFWQYFRH